MKDGAFGNIARAIVVVGLAFVSCYAWIESGHVIGSGWGVLAFLSWMFWGWKDKN